MTKVLPQVNNPQYIGFSDFDETYIAYKQTKEELKALRSLEQFLCETAISQNLVFGWVTGSSYKYVKWKIAELKLKIMPHFIACDLGSTLLIWDYEKNEYVENKIWSQPPDSSCTIADKAVVIIDELKNIFNADVFLQSPTQQSARKCSCYLNLRHRQLPEIFDHVKLRAKELKLGLNASACNVATGDPDGHCDIDFVPFGCGKDKVVKFLLEHYKIPFEQSMAFGDSGNDTKMLKAVKYGFVVDNATAEAKRMHNLHSKFGHAKAIEEEIKYILLFNECRYENHP